MQTSQEIDKLAQALAKAQGVIEDAEKDCTNPHFKSKYAGLSSVRQAIRKPLAANGLAYVQTLRYDASGVEIETRLVHESGQFIGDSLRIPCQATAQAIGSAVSYGRRYSLLAIIGLATDDDDGNSAQPAQAAKPATKKAPAPVPNGSEFNLAKPLAEDEPLLERIRRELASKDKTEEAAAQHVSGDHRKHLAQLTVGEGMRILALLEPKGKKAPTQAAAGSGT